MIISVLIFFIRFFLLFCNNVLKLSVILSCRVLQINAKLINTNNMNEIIINRELTQLLADICYLGVELYN